MMFYPETAVPPATMKTDEFLLTPLRPAHVQLDYNALMVSKEMLRLWGGHGWPSDDFTLVENLKDLEWHDMEHLERIAFTYTVLNPDETECLGCVYIRPLSDVLNDAPDFHAIMRFWVIQPRLADGLEGRLLQTLRDWFTSDAWQFERVLVHTPVAHLHQITTFENAGLPQAFTIDLEERGGYHHFYDLIEESS